MWGRKGEGGEKQHFSAALKAAKPLPGHGGSWRNPGKPSPDSTNRSCIEASGQGETPGNKFSKSKGSSYKSKFEEVKPTQRGEQVWGHRGWAKPPWAKHMEWEKSKRYNPSITRLIQTCE